MSAPTSPRLPACRIPSILTLREELGYGDRVLPRCRAFGYDINAFRERFQTKSGTAGVKLHDWKSSQGQADLKEITDAYLDREGNGLRFWPDDENSPEYNTYQYSRDATL